MHQGESSNNALHTFDTTNQGNPESVYGMIKIRSYMFNFHQKYKGQSMVEFCVAAPVLVLLLWSILYLKEMFIIKHQTLVAARYGTWLLSRNDNLPVNQINRKQVEDLIAGNFFKDKPRKNLSVQPNYIGADFEDVELFRDGTDDFILWMSGFLGKTLLHANTQSLYSLVVKYKYPRVFGTVDLRKGRNKYFEIQSEHCILGNSWDGQRVAVHDLKEMIEARIGDILNRVKNLF